MYERARPRIRFRDDEGCSGPILIFFFSLDSSCPPLKMCCQNFRITKTKEVTGVNSPQIYFKAMVRRGEGGAFSSSDSRDTMKHDVIGGGKFKYMKEISRT